MKLTKQYVERVIELAEKLNTAIKDDLSIPTEILMRSSHLTGFLHALRHVEAVEEDEQ